VRNITEKKAENAKLKQILCFKAVSLELSSHSGKTTDLEHLIMSFITT